MTSAGHIQPSFQGIVLTSRDALLLFTQAINGRIPMINRRPHDKERGTSIASGNVFIYSEGNSSIKRWTDGVAWSPSRIMGNFLIYRELNKGFPPGEKKRAAKRKTSQDDTESGMDSNDEGLPPLNITKEEERQLIGSLVDSYDFKKEGLVKKTISVKLNDQVYHLVSYYNLRHAVAGNLIQHQPSRMPGFAHVTILEDLINGQNFRVAVD
ncbi:Gti1/Pac2 family-domain-containing protein, partial [Sphaerosporella brunnea]